ncbi:MAG: class I SAM-dependent DNA methyltransferase [Caldilineaceae bacterium]
MKNFTNKVNLIWEIADLLRGDYKPREYVDVILPMTVFYRLDLAIAGTRDAVRKAYDTYGARLSDPSDLLKSAAGGSLVYNTSQFDWDSLLAAPNDIAQNLIHYLNGYSPEVQDIIEKFDFRRQISRLQASKLIYPIMQRLLAVDLHPDSVTNEEMGYIFEELIRKFSEQYNETAGEHFTPREVIRLMVELIFTEDDEVLHVPHKIRKVYDPACGTGGMLTIAKDYITDSKRNPNANVVLFGQELNPSAYAVAKSDMLLKGEDPDNIVFGNSFSEDGYKGQSFNIMLSNPPFGVSWKKVEWVIKQEHERQGMDGRFGAGLPRINDGALLFLQHILSKMDREEGSRIAIIFNGSPLFTGDAGSGESEIRRWILENDWLEGIVALPDQLFYNTGISTYIWVLTNRKRAERKGKVQLVNAADFYRRMRKSLGSKRNQIKYPSDEDPNALDQIGMIAKIYRNFDGPDFAIPAAFLSEAMQKEDATSYPSSEFNRIYPTHFFGYRKVRIDRPLRLNFQATPERIARMEAESTFQSLAKSKKKDDEEREAEEAQGRELQKAILQMLASLPADLIKDRKAFLKVLRREARVHGIKLTVGLEKAIVSALGESDPTAAICFDKEGKPEPDGNLRDYENVPLPDEEEYATYTPGDSWLDEKVPLTEDVWDYFQREVKPHVDDAYIDAGFIDDRDGKVGRVGYEISFSRYFYKYIQPRPIEEIETDIRMLETQIMQLLAKVSGNVD